MLTVVVVSQPLASSTSNVYVPADKPNAVSLLLRLVELPKPYQE